MASLPSGKIIHKPISSSSPIRHELILGWGFHYFVGFAYVVIYIFIVYTLFNSSPTLLSASLFGLLTVIAPWFFLQPGLGLGVFARKAPNPNLL